MQIAFQFQVVESFILKFIVALPFPVAVATNNDTSEQQEKTDSSS